MIRSLIALALLTLAIGTPAVALAANDVALASEMLVERTVKQANGTTKVVLEVPKSVLPGARLVFDLSYRNTGSAPATNFAMPVKANGIGGVRVMLEDGS